MCRIDEYWRKLLKIKNSLGETKYPNVEKVIKMLLTLWYGQAAVERGFSISQWALTDNMSAMTKRTLNAILTVKDGIKHYKYPYLNPISTK